MEKDCTNCKYEKSSGLDEPCLSCTVENDHFVPKESTLKDSGDRTSFETGAVRDMHTGKGRYDLIPWGAIGELAKHCEDGAIKYGERNIDKGIPIHSLIDSGIRHLSRYLQGHKDEPHLRAALWNIAWAMEFEVNMPEMQDIPNRLKEVEDDGSGTNTEGKA